MRGEGALSSLPPMMSNVIYVGAGLAQDSSRWSWVVSGGEGELAGRGAGLVGKKGGREAELEGGSGAAGLDGGDQGRGGWWEAAGQGGQGQQGWPGEMGGGAVGGKQSWLVGGGLGVAGLAGGYRGRGGQQEAELDGGGDWG